MQALQYLRISARDEARKLVTEVTKSVLKLQAGDGSLDSEKAATWFAGKIWYLVVHAHGLLDVLQTPYAILLTDSSD